MKRIIALVTLLIVVLAVSSAEARPRGDYGRHGGPGYGRHYGPPAYCPPQPPYWEPPRHHRPPLIVIPPGRHRPPIVIMPPRRHHNPPPRYYPHDGYGRERHHRGGWR